MLKLAGLIALLVLAPPEAAEPERTGAHVAATPENHQPARMTPQPADVDPQPADVDPQPADVDQQPTRVLQVRDDVEVPSRIIRLKDIVVPVGEPPQGWARAASAAVALLPSDGRRLRIERQRVSESVRRSGLIAEAVRFVGPEYVAVRYVPIAIPQAVSSTVPSNTTTMAPDTTRSAAVTTATAIEQTAFQGDAIPTTAERPVTSATESFPALLPAERNRIARMIQADFGRSHAEITERFEVAIDELDAGINALGNLRGIRTLRMMSPPASGPIRLEVVGDGQAGEVTAIIQIHLNELPAAVVAVSSLNRGDILSHRDLETKHLPRHQFRDDYATDLESLVGKEAIRSIAAGRPIRYDDIGEPIVIHRGDLVELRVVGGGVTVSTNAKALAPASAGEMIMVETDSPRRRLMARAVHTGIVEILTRPPTTAPEIHGE